MKRHRKLETWIADARKHLLHPCVNTNDSPLFGMAWELSDFKRQLRNDVAQIRAMVELLRLLRVSRGPGRGSFEEGVFEKLVYQVHLNCSELLDAGVTRSPTFDVPDGIAPDLRPLGEVIVELCKYALDCLTFSQPRDTLAGNRRRYALELLGEASYMFEMPESVLTFVRQTIKTGRTPSVTGAILFCKHYYTAWDLPVPDDTEELLLALLKRTDRCSVATRALCTLADSGNISEFDASDRLYEWEEEHCYGRAKETP